MTALSENILCKKARINKDQESNGDIANFIHNKFKESGKENIVFVNIGTDKAIYDCFAPMLGTLLEDNDSKFKIYGNLDNPIHALNIHKKLEAIIEENKNNFIIGVDAAFSEDDDIGDIIVRNKPVQPGKGVGKKLPNTGDISIIAITGMNSHSSFLGNNTRLSEIMNMCKKAIKEIKILENMLFAEKELKEVV